jgi:hypothetical protein
VDRRSNAFDFSISKLAQPRRRGVCGADTHMASGHGEEE